jgi:hypothetical protein
MVNKAQEVTKAHKEDLEPRVSMGHKAKWVFKATRVFMEIKAHKGSKADLAPRVS